MSLSSQEDTPPLSHTAPVEYRRTLARSPSSGSGVAVSPGERSSPSEGLMRKVQRAMGSRVEPLHSSRLQDLHFSSMENMGNGVRDQRQTTFQHIMESGNLTQEFTAISCVWYDEKRSRLVATFWELEDETRYSSGRQVVEVVMALETLLDSFYKNIPV
eukprot:CAMPEP_0119142014 /NCGR_PEP_ID=MMETSP1310-20130426/31972_1 /TAXON_ID=464262 /ORGANISM="Genus nov. species nov., Strain RCC2339" /LENGTH=158 /DNA_ID=CAMNT_0007133519 /DNA_START=5 /DNA_END=477 /DNA_ORIENTATION=+